MGYTFQLGDCLMLEPASVDNIRLGDIVAYRLTGNKGDSDVVHRVVKIVPNGLITRGDNNIQVDAGIVDQDRLLGKVTHLERNGRVLMVSCGPRGLVWSKFLHFLLYVRCLMSSFIRWPYRLLSRSGIVPQLLRPAIVRLSLSVDNKPLIKYVSKGKTLAQWWPQQNRFVCKKPYDLVIRHEDLAQQAAPSNSRIE